MKPFQGTIEVRDGIIESLIPGYGFVKIVNHSENLLEKDVVHNLSESLYSNSYAYPGFVDSHGHLPYLGEKLQSTNLNHCYSPEDVVNKILAAPYLRGNWIFF